MAEESVFLAALDRTDPAERQKFLDEACAGDPDLRRRIDVLLAAYAAGKDRLEPPGNGTVAYVPSAEVGTIIAGRYKLLEEIGVGGMGTVWVAEQTEPVKRKVALKLIKAGMDSKSVLARFEAERQALAVMDHPNIAKVLDGGLTETGRPFFVMEYVKGVPITEYCDATRLSVPERLNLFVQVCSAVQHAHQKGIIHRDLKPSNILVAPYDDKPVPKVIDFGLAKAMHQSLTERTLHTAHETVLGTPLYMSPEQAQLNNLDVDTRSDIYSLGVLLYELLTGTTPLEKKRFKEAAWDEIKRIIREEEAPRPSTRLSSSNTLASLAAGRQIEPARLTKLVRGELDWIVMKALEKDRTRRYDTANGFAMDVRRYLSGEPVLAVPPSASYRLRKFARKNRAGLTMAAAIGLLLVAGAAVSTWQAVRAKRAEKDANDQRQSALAAQSRAESINRFLLDDLLKQANPEFNPVGDKITIRELLDKASTRLDSQNSLADQPEVEAEVRAVIGQAYEYLSDYGTAERHFRKAWELRCRVLGQEHLETISIRNRLICAIVQLDRLAEAEATAPGALDMCDRLLGADHLETAEAANNLGELRTNQRRFTEAIALRRRASQIAQRHKGPNNNKCMEYDNNLATTLVLAGQPAEAVTLLQSVADRRRKYTPRHPELATSLSNLGATLIALGRYSEAEPVVREAIHRQRASRGKDSSPELAAQNLLGYSLEGQRRWADAEKEYSDVLTKRRQQFGPTSVPSRKTLVFIARLYAKQDRWPEAARHLAELILAQRPDPNRTTDALAKTLIAALDGTMPPAQAELLLRESHDALEQVMWPGDWLTAEISARIGVCLGRQHRYSEAEKLLLEADYAIDAAFGVPPTATTTSRERLVRLYETWDKLDKAAKWRKELPQNEKGPRPREIK